MEQKYCHIMIGLPGSGKSTWIKENVFDQKTRIISTDNILEDIAKKHDLTYNEVFSDNIEEATKQFWNEIDEATFNGENIIIDRTNMTVSSRRKIISRIPKNYHIVGVNVSCNDSLTHSMRLASRKGKHIPTHIVENMARSYQIPTKDEGFDSITFLNTASDTE